MSRLRKKKLDRLRTEFRGLHNLKYTSAQEMEPVIKEYFDHADSVQKHYTVAGLISHLGFSSRQTLEDYRKREEFHELVERAFLHIEDQRNQQLIAGQGVVAGQIFDLKMNHGWRDKDVQNQDTGGNKVIVVPVLPGALDMQQWAQFYQGMIEARKPAAIDVQKQDTQPRTVGSDRDAGGSVDSAHGAVDVEFCAIPPSSPPS